MHTALDRCLLFSKKLFSLSPTQILRIVYFCYEMSNVMHYFSGDLQSETFFQLQVNLEMSKLHV